MKMGLEMTQAAGKNNQDHCSSSAFGAQKRGEETCQESLLCSDSSVSVQKFPSFSFQFCSCGSSSSAAATATAPLHHHKSFFCTAPPSRRRLKIHQECNVSPSSRAIFLPSSFFSILIKEKWLCVTFLSSVRSREDHIILLFSSSSTSVRCCCVFECAPASRG